MKESLSSRHLDFLDGTRGLAALYVLLHHIWLAAYPQAVPGNACQLCLAAPAWTRSLLWGQLAVVVFMVVSGFSLGLAPVRHGNRLSEGFRAYIVRRAFRIIPPYWAALAVSCLVIVVLTGPYRGDAVTAKAVIVHTLLVQNVIDSPKPNGAFWSIAVEWQIYFIFPLLLLLWRKAGGTAMVLATTLVALAVHAAGTHFSQLEASFGLQAGALASLSKLLYLRPHFVVLFALGVAAAHAVFVKGWMQSVPWTAVGWVLTAATVSWLWALPTEQVERHFFWIDLAAGAAAAALLAGFSQRPSGGVARLLGSRLPRWLGQSSYSLYLIHVPVLEVIAFTVVAPLVTGHDSRFVLLIALVVPAAVLASRLFWRVFELPFMKYRSFGAFRGALIQVRQAWR